jgi:membrane protease YdiL (CAAX protease family)
VKTYQRLFIVALLALAMTVLLSPWAAAAWSHFVARSPWQSSQYSFSRIFSRVFMISGISLFIIFRRFLKLGSLENLGLKPLVHARRDISLGVLLSLGSLVGLVVVMSLMDIFTPFFRLSVSKSLMRCGSALLAAVAVGTVEEIFFRGIFFKGLREDLGRLRGYLYAAIFFAAIHFVRPTHDVVEINGLTGIRYLIDSFHVFLDPVSLLAGFIGLFSIGLVLCYAFERTGKLYLSIGLHAGWIFGLKTIRVFGDFARQDLGWIFGSQDPKIVSGVATWIGVFLVGLIIHALTQRRPRPECNQTPAVVGSADLLTRRTTPTNLSKL